MIEKEVYERLLKLGHKKRMARKLIAGVREKRKLGEIEWRKRETIRLLGLLY